MAAEDDGPRLAVERRRWNGAPVACAVLGAWVFIWALLLPQQSERRTPTLILGGLIAITSAVAVRVPAASWIDTLLAAVLFVDSVFLTHGVAGAAWHNAIVAVVIFVLSFVSSRVRGGVIR
jgi:hypothetical protein